jgi:hypothetical protein
MWRIRHPSCPKVPPSVASRVDIGIDVDNRHAHVEVNAIIDLDVGIDVAMDMGIATQNMCTHMHLRTQAKHMDESGN